MIGTQVGPYRLVKLLGAGGMGQVYLAEHTTLKDLHAIKILDPELTQKPQIVTRFVNEARAAAKLRHRNLIRVHHIDRLPNDGPWYMVLDYLEGGTLARFMASHGGPIATHTIVHILAQVAGCIQHVHDRQVVHRDLKPENIFLVQREEDPHFPIVLDLGVAQLGEDLATGPATRTGTVIGTPIYMAPEQLRGERVTPAADIFALGVIAYEMATGGWFPYQHHETRQAFFELAATEIYYRQRSAPPVDPQVRFAGITPAWRDALLAALDADPAKRPGSARELALLFARATPTDGLHADGLAIVRDVARELTQGDNMLETIRTPRPSPDGTSPPKSESRYKMLDKLGAGGMAEVFLATQAGVEGFAKRVAIKRVLAGLSEVPAFATMFVSEAKLTSQLAHPNIVTVLDFSRDDDGRLFLVMEYVHGRDLAALLDTGPLPPSLTIYIVVELLRGLGYAHDVVDPSTQSRGLVHRDVSPHNVLLSYEGAVKVSDFGLAKARSASGNVRTDTVRGKPSYMSPEQCNGEVLDGRSDLFAVGVMLWEMLANQSMFTGTPNETIAQVLFKRIVPASSLRSRVPADLDAVAMRLLARELAVRYPTAEAAIADLVRCADAPIDGRSELAATLAARFPDATVRSRRGGSGSQPAPRGLLAAQMTVPAPSQSAAPRRRTGRLAGLAAIVLVAGVVAFALVRAATSTPDATIAMPNRDPSAAPVASAVGLDASIPDVPTDAAQAIDAGLPALAAPTPDAGTGSGKPPAPHRPPVPAGKGELAIIVKPWAEIWLNGKSVGQTPYRATIAAGRYRLRIANDDKNEALMITVKPDQTTTIERKW